MKRILARKRRGAIGAILGYFLIIMVVLYFVYSLRLRETELTALEVQSSLNMATVSGSIVDLMELGEFGELVVGDPEQSYENFVSSLSHSLGLDGEMKSSKGSIVSPVKVERYIIYNVYKNGDIQIIEIDTSTGNAAYAGSLESVGDVETPSDTLVGASCIYSRISFDIKGFLSSTLHVQMESCMDMTR